MGKRKTPPATDAPADDSKKARNSKPRIYVVHKDGEPIALARAISQSHAIRLVIGNDGFEAVVADQDHLIKHAGKLPLVEPKADEATE